MQTKTRGRRTDPGGTKKNPKTIGFYDVRGNEEQVLGNTTITSLKEINNDLSSKSEKGEFLAPSCDTKDSGSETLEIYDAAKSAILNNGKFQQSSTRQLDTEDMSQVTLLRCDQIKENEAFNRREKLLPKIMYREGSTSKTVSSLAKGNAIKPKKRIPQRSFEKRVSSNIRFQSTSTTSSSSGSSFDYPGFSSTVSSNSTNSDHLSVHTACPPLLRRQSDVRESKKILTRKYSEYNSFKNISPSPVDDTSDVPSTNTAKESESETVFTSWSDDRQACKNRRVTATEFNTNRPRPLSGRPPWKSQSAPGERRERKWGIKHTFDGTKNDMKTGTSSNCVQEDSIVEGQSTKERQKIERKLYIKGDGTVEKRKDLNGFEIIIFNDAKVQRMENKVTSYKDIKKAKRSKNVKIKTNRKRKKKMDYNLGTFTKVKESIMEYLFSSGCKNVTYEDNCFQVSKNSKKKTFSSSVQTGNDDVLNPGYILVDNNWHNKVFEKLEHESAGNNMFSSYYQLGQSRKGKKVENWLHGQWEQNKGNHSGSSETSSTIESPREMNFIMERAHQVNISRDMQHLPLKSILKKSSGSDNESIDTQNKKKNTVTYQLPPGAVDLEEGETQEKRTESMQNNYGSEVTALTAELLSKKTSGFDVKCTTKAPTTFSIPSFQEFIYPKTVMSYWNIDACSTIRRPISIFENSALISDFLETDGLETENTFSVHELNCDQNCTEVSCAETCKTSFDDMMVTTQERCSMSMENSTDAKEIIDIFTQHELLDADSQRRKEEQSENNVDSNNNRMTNGRRIVLRGWKQKYEVILGLVKEPGRLLPEFLQEEIQLLESKRQGYAIERALVQANIHTWESMGGIRGNRMKDKSESIRSLYEQVANLDCMLTSLETQIEVLTAVQSNLPKEFHDEHILHAYLPL